MAHTAQTRVQEALNESLENLDKSCMRKMQGNMHLCAAKCCERKMATMEEIHQCIQSCSENMVKAQQYVQGELQNFQDRMQRCALQCQDDIRDRVTPDTTEAQVSEYKKGYETCIVNCADNHIEFLPTMLKRMKDMLGKGGFVNELV